jgi:adenylate cyclase
MQETLPEFNSKLIARELPIVTMRAGISTGEMIVGDAGGDRTDYTVLGDVVNFGARLEGANKFTGTRILVSARTAALAGDAFLMRPIAKLVVVGKTEAEMVYEPLGYRDQATDEQRQLVTRTRAVIDAFAAGDFKGCLELLAELEKTHGPSKLVDLYREQCIELTTNPPEGTFDGRVVLTAKG